MRLGCEDSSTVVLIEKIEDLEQHIAVHDDKDDTNRSEKVCPIYIKFSYHLIQCCFSFIVDIDPPLLEHPQEVVVPLSVVKQDGEAGRRGDPNSRDQRQEAVRGHWDDILMGRGNFKYI